MKLLLFDENISPRLVDRLADIFPGSVHVNTIGLGKAFNREIWEYARQNDFMIVTKDADFSELSLLGSTVFNGKTISKHKVHEGHEGEHL